MHSSGEAPPSPRGVQDRQPGLVGRVEALRGDPRQGAGLGAGAVLVIDVEEERGRRLLGGRRRGRWAYPRAFEDARERGAERGEAARAEAGEHGEAAVPLGGFEIAQRLDAEALV